MDAFNLKCSIECNDKLGRYVIANEDIKSGETILLESPTLVVPWPGEIRCANCLRLTKTFCRICRIFPLCNNCKQHTKFDCQFFAQIKDFPTQQLQSSISCTFSLLKALLLGENNENKEYFQELLKMEAHMKERRNTDIWKHHAINSIQPLLDSGLIKHLNNALSIDEEFLQRLCGILDVNSFEVRTPDENSMRAIFLKAAALNHSCMQNVAIAIDEHYRIKIFANKDIGKGEMLLNCYTNVLLSTTERRQALLSGKYFHCTCSRCEDPTELGSHMSSLICTVCASKKLEGFVVQKDSNIWQCLTCQHTVQSKNVESLLEHTKEEIFHAKDDIYRFEILLAKLSRIFHRNHYLIIDLKQNIASILRSYIMNLTERPDHKVYERKVCLCQHIISVLQIVQPGISRLRAIALYEFCTAFVELNRLRFEKKEIIESELLTFLQQSESMLHEAVRMLLYEPVETPEGQLAKEMLRELKDIQTDIKKLQKSFSIK